MSAIEKRIVAALTADQDIASLEIAELIEEAEGGYRTPKRKSTRTAYQCRFMS